MKLPTKPKLPQVPDPGATFRFERQTPLAGGGWQILSVNIKDKTIKWLALLGAVTFGTYHNLDTALPLLKRFFLP